jgi:hypothetical protein
MKCLAFALLALGSCTPDVDELPVQPNGAPTVFSGTSGSGGGVTPGPDAGTGPAPNFPDGGVFSGDAGQRLFDATNYGDVGQSPYDASAYADAQIPPFP